MATYPRNPMAGTNIELRLENKYYKKYLKQKEKIQSKYPNVIVGEGEARIVEGLVRGKRVYTTEERNKHRKYLKELGDLMYKKGGWFQKFIWDSISVSEKIEMEKKATGKPFYHTKL